MYLTCQVPRTEHIRLFVHILYSCQLFLSLNMHDLRLYVTLQSFDFKTVTIDYYSKFGYKRTWLHKHNLLKDRRFLSENLYTEKFRIGG